MKKNFFKKLSFVLALAMIVTALAPAAGAFAAKAPKLNASSKYLYLGVDKKDEFDFNISNKVKGWKYLWTTANDDVVSVNKKNGLVTAEAAGSTKVSVVITDKDGEEVDELTATVTVRDNIKELTLTNLPKDGKVAVGVAHDFNRSYVTVANKTKGSKGITRWSVTPSEGATITDMGVFTATKAGEYTITARAFQSKAKYTSWLSDATKYASYVTSNEATYKVTVAPSMVSAKQVNLKKFNVVFDSAMTKEDITKNLTAKYVLGGTKVTEGIKSVSMSADNKTATIEANYDLSKGMTYVVEYPNMKAVEFVSATTNFKDVVDMAILTKTAQISKDTKLDIALYNKDGVNIANDELLQRITTDKADNNYAYLQTHTKLYMHKLGEVVKLTSTYHTYDWKDGKEVGNVSATAEVTCVEVVKEIAGELYAWTIKDSDPTKAPTNFNTTKTQTFKGDNSKKLYVLLKGKDTNGDDKYISNFNYTGSPSASQGTYGWKYTSSNPSVLLTDSSGGIFGVKEGTAAVVVSYNDVQIGACEVTVTGARKAASAELSKSTITLSRAFSDPIILSYKIKDQFNDDYKAADGSWDVNVDVRYNGSEGSNPSTSTTALTFNAAGLRATTYNYTVKFTDKNDSGVSVTLPLSVVVQDPGNNTTIASYRIEADKETYDVKSGSSISTEEVQLSVYAYNSAGVKLSKHTVSDLTALGSRVDVAMAGTSTGSAIINATDKISLVSTKTVTGGRQVVDPLKTGAWLITGSNTNTPGTPTTHNKPVYAVGFEVKNTQSEVKYELKTSYTDKYLLSDLAAVINECISFTSGDTRLFAENGGYIGVSPANYQIMDNRVALYKIKLYNMISGGLYVEYEVDLKGLHLTVK